MDAVMNAEQDRQLAPRDTFNAARAELTQLRARLRAYEGEPVTVGDIDKRLTDALRDLGTRLADNAVTLSHDEAKLLHDNLWTLLDPPVAAGTTSPEHERT